MEADFKVIVITPESIIDDEPQRIARLLRSGAVWRVHVRHPHAEAAQIDALIAKIPADLHCRLSLHDCYHLAAKYPGIGVHLNARNVAPSFLLPSLSKSCHSIAEMQQANCDYVTLSPIFNSISKAGYQSAFSLDDELKAALCGHRVFALGGVTPDKFEQLKDVGFAGAALLGYVWQADINEFNKRIDSIYAAIHH